MRHRAGRLLAGLTVAVLFAPSQSTATSTGLNNIVTAETPADGEVVIQGYSDFGEGRGPDYFAGLKTGLVLYRRWDVRLEAGIDSRLGAGKAGPAVFQAKLATKPWEYMPALALGATNIAVTDHDRDRTGDPFKFVVLTQDLLWLNATAGYGFQPDNDAAFFGLDRWFELADTGLQLRGDVTQIEDGKEWKGSLGFLWVFWDHLAIETWGSQRFDGGDIVWTIKLDLIGNYKRLFKTN
jgi:hypothetical protein